MKTIACLRQGAYWVLLACTATSASAVEKEITLRDDAPITYVNAMKDDLARLSADPTYMVVYPITLLKPGIACDAPADQRTGNEVNIPVGASLKVAAQSDPEPGSMLVHVYKVPGKQGDDEMVKTTYFNAPLRLCETGGFKVNADAYRREGGMNTGMLVVPFKLRKGDIYGDSAIGPYVSYTFRRLEFLATAGLSQISTVETNGEDLKNETGLTIALGLKFQVKKDWAIALIVGADHLSGKAGDEWRYQDKPWISFAIGFDFAQ